MMTRELFELARAVGVPEAALAHISQLESGDGSYESPLSKIFVGNVDELLEAASQLQDSALYGDHPQHVALQMITQAYRLLSSEVVDVST